MVGPELAGVFAALTPLAWYDGEKPLEVWRRLRGLLSDETMAEMGIAFAATLLEFFGYPVPTPEAALRCIPAGYGECWRGPGAGGWRVDEAGGGAAVLSEDGVTRDAPFGEGLVRGALEAAGATHIRVASRLNGAGRLTYEVGWDWRPADGPRAG